jgi:anti-sigma B factor antagonist
MPEADFPAEVVSGVPVVAAPEAIDITNAPGLRSVLLEAAAHGGGTLVVDLSQTQFCDSAGLQVLVRAHRRAQAEGGDVRLVVAGSNVRRILAITGIDQVIPTFASLEQALPRASAAAIQPLAQGS